VHHVGNCCVVCLSKLAPKII